METVGRLRTRVDRREDQLEQRQHPGTDQGHHDEARGAEAEEEKDVDRGDGEAGHGCTMAETAAAPALAYDAGVSEARPASPAPVGEEDRRDGGRVVFRARRPAALVIPLAVVTETAGVLFLLNGATIGWFVCAAPAVALVATGLVLRPSLELTREGLLQRQYPFSSLTRWEVIDAMGITRAGNRVVLAYRLVAGIPPPRRQPAASLLRAAQRPYDGGYFVDSLVGDPDRILATVEEYRASAELRAALPHVQR
jgi:hypothetical protein